MSTPASPDDGPAVADPTATAGAGSPAIAVERLTRRYGELVALNGVSFEVARGEIFGVLGPNGAGKTTLLDTLEGLARPQGGSARVLGLDVAREPQRVKQRIGVQLQASSYPAYLTLAEILELFGSFYDRRADAAALLERVGLADRARSRVGQLSGGLAQRFSIVAALVNEPEVVFLDEPTAGLDPDARRALWELVREVRRGGTTVVLTTHYMEEAELLCDRVAILDGGRVVALDTPRALVRRLAAPYRVRLLTREPLPQARLAALAGVTAVGQERTEDGALARLDAASAEAAAAAAALAHEAGAGLLDLLVEPATLEDLFLALTGRHLGHERAEAAAQPADSAAGRRGRLMRILLGAQVKVLVRDRQSLFWALVFPLMLLGIFRLFSFDAFSEQELVVSDRSQTAAGASLEGAVASLDFLDVEARPGLTDEAALALLDDGDADAVLLIGPQPAGGPLPAELLHAIDDPVRLAALRAALGSVVDDVNIGLTGAPRAVELSTRASGASDSTYFDFLAPGIIGLALLTFSTIGLASSLARYREEGVLRRVRATPLPPWRFFASLVGSYLLLAVVQIALLLLFATVLGADVLQGVLALALFALLGNLVFLNLGVVVAGLVRGRYAVEGAANAVTFPMMFLSGSFFPTSALPDVVQKMVELLPLTHLLRAMRAVSLDGASAWSQAPELGVLLAWVALSALAARATFRLGDA